MLKQNDCIIKRNNEALDIQTRMLADALNVEEKDILKAVNLYTDALTG